MKNIVKILIIYISLIGFNSVNAENISVINGNDSGSGSLREAIQIAQNGDEIIILDTISTIFLNSTLFIDKSITITKLGTYLVVLEGDECLTFRLIEINGASLSVVFNKLLFYKGAHQVEQSM